MSAVVTFRYAADTDERGPAVEVAGNLECEFLLAALALRPYGEMDVAEFLRRVNSAESEAQAARRVLLGETLDALKRLAKEAPSTELMIYWR